MSVSDFSCQSRYLKLLVKAESLRKNIDDPTVSKLNGLVRRESLKKQYKRASKATLKELGLEDRIPGNKKSAPEKKKKNKKTGRKSNPTVVKPQVVISCEAKVNGDKSVAQTNEDRLREKIRKEEIQALVKTPYGFGRTDYIESKGNGL